MVKRLLFGLLLLVWMASMLPAQPQRIVSTAPSITEMLFALGLGDRVVGVTTFCNYPPEARTRPKIGDYLRPDVEAILALQPDLVIAEQSMIRHSVHLPALRLNVLEVDDADIDGIHKSILQIGRAAGVPDRAAALSESIREQLDEIGRRTAADPKRTVLLVVGRTPGRLEDLIAVGKASYLNQVIEISGGENVFKDAVASYAKIPIEEVLSRNPDVIIDMGEMAETASVTDEQKRRVVALYDRFPTLAAVREGKVFAVASDVLFVPGPRVVDACRRFAEILHPEAGR